MQATATKDKAGGIPTPGAASAWLGVAVTLALVSPARADEGSYDATPCGKCHAALQKHKTVHPALAAGTCADCHLPAGDAGKCKSPLAKGWKLKAPDPSLCRDCHARDDNAPLHPVIDSMGCTACHDPHGSDTPHLLKAASVGELCKTCHDGVADLKHPHTPVKTGDCTSCHDPHASALPHLLKAKTDDLCGKCHAPDKLMPGRSKHAPVGEGACSSCHLAHGGKLPKGLIADAGDLCMKCHDAKMAVRKLAPARIDLRKKVVHAALDAGGCLACHVAGHSSVLPKLLAKRPVELCNDCHERKDGTAFVHGAVRLGDCAVCHEPHSSDHAALLRKEKPADNCFLCHADDATTRAVVHRPVAAGQCTTCHDPHGAANEWSSKRGAGKALCESCHKPVDTGKHKHAVLERGGCQTCHDPHATNHPFLLPKPVNQLCQPCHAEQMGGAHVSSLVPKGHKVSGGPDPHNVDREFSCASCHNPHGSDSPKLLRFGENTMEVCDWCHGDRMGKHPELKDIRKRKPTDKNADDYRKEVPSPLRPGAWPLSGRPTAVPRDAGAPTSPADAGAADARPSPHDIP